MNPRRFSATLFVILCLALSGLLLRHQIAAHPRHVNLPDASLRPDDRIPSDFVGQPVDRRTWHIAHGAQRQAVLDSVEGEWDALRSGDWERAQFYQSRVMRAHYPSQEALAALLSDYYPAFAHSRITSFGPVWMDAAGQHADVTVTARGANGTLAQGDYRMIRGREIYKVADIVSGRKFKN